MSQKYDPTDLRFNPTIPEREGRTFSLLSEDSDPHRPQRLKGDTVDLLTALSMGVDPADATLRRYLPVDIYINVDDRHDPFADEVIIATEILLVRFGLLEDERTLIEFGSIRKRSRWYTKDKQTLNQLSEKMDMLEKAFHSANEGQLRMRIAQPGGASSPGQRRSGRGGGGRRTDFPAGSHVMFWGAYGAFEDGTYSEWIAVRKEDLCLLRH
jgi:hypothetical protein